jgi:uncharacterized Zn-binding protein involved in type VI secretion
MASLPDGTTVTQQTSEGFNLAPPSNLALITGEGFNLNPPVFQHGVTLSASTTVTVEGEQVTFSGEATRQGDPLSGEPVTVLLTAPDDATTTVETTTDSNGKWEATTSLDSTGDWAVIAEIDRPAPRTTEYFNT